MIGCAKRWLRRVLPTRVELDDVAIPQRLKYRAFISYSSDDRRQSAWLHRKLERYRVPTGLVGKSGEFGEIPARVGRIFRDRDDARAASSLKCELAARIADSQHMIVLCSESATRSDCWVGPEIELFRRRRPDGPIQAVICKDEPPGCFPAQLVSAGEPLGADLRRWYQGGRDGRSKALAKLIAALIGADFDDLWQRERRRRVARVVVGSLLIASAATASVGLVHVMRTMQVVDRHSALSTSAFRAHRWDLAALASASALAREATLGPFASEAPLARLKSLRSTGRTHAILSGATKTLTAGRLQLDAGLALATSLDGSIYGWDFENNEPGAGDPHRIFRAPGRARGLDLSGDGALAFAYVGSRLVVVEVADKVVIGAPRFQATVRALAVVGDEGLVAIGLQDGGVWLVSGERYAQRKQVFAGPGPVASLTVDPSGVHLGIGDGSGAIHLVEVAKGATSLRTIAGRDGDTLFHLSSSPEYLVASRDDSATLYKWGSGEVVSWFSRDDGSVWHSEIAPSGHTGFSLMNAGALAIWNLPEAELVAKPVPTGCRDSDPFTYACRVSVAIFVPDREGRGERIIAGYWDGAIRLWSTKGDLVGLLRGHVARVSTLSVSADRRLLLSGSEDHSARLWSLDAMPDDPLEALRSYCRQTDPRLLRDTPLVRGEGLRFEPTHDSGLIEATGLLEQLQEVGVPDPCELASPPDL